MPAPLWSYIYAAGAAQGVLLALALWRRPDRRCSYRLLSGWIALLSVHLCILALYLHAEAPSPTLLRSYGLTRFLPFLYAAWFYAYVRSLTRAPDTPPGRLWLHLLPFALAMLAHADFIALPADELRTLFLYGRLPPAIALWRLATLDLALFACGLAYLIAAARLVWHYRERVAQERADADRQGLQWLAAMAAWQAAIWGVALLQTLVHLPGIDVWLIYGVVSAWIWALGYVSLASPQPADLTLDDADAPTTPPASDDDDRYAQVLARVDQLVGDEQLYRQPALGIAALAKRSGYPEYLVSQAINRVRGTNFYEFINRWRVQAVQQAIADPHNAQTLLDMAYDAGFTSKSTFNQAFKRYVGTTPSAYRKSLLATARPDSD